MAATSISSSTTGRAPSCNRAPTRSPTAAWYFFVVNFDRDGNATLYVNGSPEVSLNISAQAGNVNSVSAFSLGGILGFYYFDGRLDSAGLWSRLLTPAEIAWLYNAGIGRIYADLAVAGNDGANLKTNLVSWWDLGEGARSQVRQPRHEPPSTGVRPDHRPEPPATAASRPGATR